MSIYKTAIEQPRKLTARKWLFQIHLWAGLILGLYMAVMGITGSALVFRDEMEEAIEHDKRIVAGNFEVSERLSAEAVASIVKAKFPEHQLTNIFLPESENHSYQGYLQKNEEYTRFLVHPYTGEILLAEDTKRGSVLRWLQHIHFYLLMGKFGFWVNGFGGISLFVLCVTGIAIWWAGKKNWKKRLVINRKANWKKFNWDLHNVVGFWTLLFLMILAVTGAYFSFPNTYRAAVGFFAPIKGGKNIPEIAAPRPEQKATSEDFIRSAQEVVPERAAGRIIYPADATKPARVFLYEGAIKEYWRVNIVYLNPNTAEVLKVEHYAEQSTGDMVMFWFGKLHFGRFGGVPVKVLWVIFGLSLPILFVTGFAMWWNRVVAKRLRESKSVAQLPIRATVLQRENL